MSDTGKMLGICFGLIIAVLIAGFLFTSMIPSIADAMRPSGVTKNGMDTVIGTLPIVVIVTIPLVKMSIVFFGGCSDDEIVEDDDEPEPEPLRVKRKDAERIIMERYAKGDISSEQYTEMMSRL